MSNRTVCLFAGAGGDNSLLSDVAEVTTRLINDGWEMIYGGSSKGCMGVICKVATARGAKLTGVLPTKIARLRHFDPAITIVEADTMAERKAHFWERSDAFVCLPGGVGTMDELFEVWTLTKLGYLNPVRPIVVLNSCGFYDPLKLMIAEMVRHGTMTEDRSGMVRFVDRPSEVIEALKGWEVKGVLSVD